MVGPSTLSKVAVCPARARFPKIKRKIKSSKPPSNPFAEEGTALHKHVEDWINRVKNEGDLEDPKSWIPLLRDEENNRIRRGASTLVNYLARLKDKKNLIVTKLDSELEGKYPHDSSGIEISYAIDLVVEMEDPEGSTYNIVIDWKRSLKHSHSAKDSNYSWQLKLYSTILHDRGCEVDEAMLISLEKDHKYMRKIPVNISTPINLDNIIEEWEGQEMRPSRENCGIECPRFTDKKNPCPEADLPSLNQISLDRSRTPFRELKLDAATWRNLVMKKTALVEEWGVVLEKSGSKIFIPEESSGSCDVRGIAQASSLPEGWKRIEVEPKIFLSLDD